MLTDLKNTYDTLRIVDIRQETKDVKTFILEPRLYYKAGQFLTFVINHHNKEERRSFSISSSPAVDEPLAVTVKRVDNGVYSRMLIDKAAPGDVLYTIGAAGLFTLPDNIDGYKQIFFFAAGIGITPIFSLLKTVLYKHPLIDVVLIYSNRNKEEVVFFDELNMLSEQFGDRLSVQYLFSTNFDLSRARLNKQLAPILIREYEKAEKENTLYYTCGPFSYMRMVIFALEEQGIPANNIKKENFNTELKPKIKAIPPDENAHTVFLKTADKNLSFVCQFPDNILTAAKKNGINLPYSCETGRCGSCAVVCTSGNVWMSNNEVLTESDLEKGRVLTCVGYPVNGDVTITTT